MLRLHLTPHTLHFKRPAPTSRGPLVTRALWLLRASDLRRSTAIGLGECGPIPGLSYDDHPDFEAHSFRLIAEINRAALDLDTVYAAQPAGDRLAFLDSLLAPWDAQLALLPSLRFAIESALLDLRNNAQGTLFDHPFTRGEADLPTHGLIWMDTQAGLLAQVQAKVAAGFNVIKMKVGALPFEEEFALLHAVRARYPHISLRLDANGACTTHIAMEIIEALAPLHIEFLEQPIRAGQREQLAALCAVSPIPIVLDEELIGQNSAEARVELLRAVRPQGIIIKPALLGGWRAATQAVAACKVLGIAWWANSLLESSIGHDAICQWTAAYGGSHVHGLGTGGLYSDNFPSPVALAGNLLHRDAVAARHIHAQIGAA